MLFEKSLFVVVSNLSLINVVLVSNQQDSTEFMIQHYSVKINIDAIYFQKRSTRGIPDA